MPISIEPDPNHFSIQSQQQARSERPGPERGVRGFALLSAATERTAAASSSTCSPQHTYSTNGIPGGLVRPHGPLDRAVTGGVGLPHGGGGGVDATAGAGGVRGPEPRPPRGRAGGWVVGLEGLAEWLAWVPRSSSDPAISIDESIPGGARVVGRRAAAQVVRGPAQALVRLGWGGWNRLMASSTGSTIDVQQAKRRH